MDSVFFNPDDTSVVFHQNITNAAHFIMVSELNNGTNIDRNAVSNFKTRIFNYVINI